MRLIGLSFNSLIIHLIIKKKCRIDFEMNRTIIYTLIIHIIIRKKCRIDCEINRTIIYILIIHLTIKRRTRMDFFKDIGR